VVGKGVSFMMITEEMNGYSIHDERVEGIIDSFQAKYPVKISNLMKLLAKRLVLGWYPAPTKPTWQKREQ